MYQPQQPVVSSTSFNIGLRFYYWQKYQEMKEMPERQISIHQKGNYDAHSGFEVCELYVKRKYGSFKQEMANYKHEFKDWRNAHMVIEKATAYARDSGVIRAIKAKGEKDEVPPYYGIKEGSALTVEHLMSVLCYTDYTKHSAAFSRSFRKMDAFESLKHIKQRNSKYFWMAKRLRETVEIYGRSSDGEQLHGTWKRQYLQGSFYTGISKVINIPCFQIRLCSPTSTTLHIEVAMKFSGEEGMLLHLGDPFGNWRCWYLRGFNVGLISRYPEEDEVYVAFVSSVSE